MEDTLLHIIPDQKLLEWMGVGCLSLRKDPVAELQVAPAEYILTFPLVNHADIDQNHQQSREWQVLTVPLDTGSVLGLCHDKPESPQIFLFAS